MTLVGDVPAVNGSFGPRSRRAESGRENLIRGASPLDSAREASRGRNQHRESGLSEMVVERRGLLQTVVSHNQKRDAVGQ
jgi:hypothetical protein